MKEQPNQPGRPEEQWKHQDSKPGAADIKTGADAEREQGNRALPKTAGGGNPHLERSKP